MKARRVRGLISVVTESEKFGGEGPRGPPTSLEIMPGDTLGGWSARTLASSFDGWVHRCSSLARVPLFCSVLKPAYDQIIVCSPLIYR